MSDSPLFSITCAATIPVPSHARKLKGVFPLMAIFMTNYNKYCPQLTEKRSNFALAPTECIEAF